MRYAFVLLVSLAGCPLHNPVPAPIDPPYPPTALADCASACSKLRQLACPEGGGSVGGSTCERTCLSATELRPLPLACWAAAGDVAAARGCGSLRCLR